jgi:hypothetical protein
LASLVSQAAPSLRCDPLPVHLGLSAVNGFTGKPVWPVLVLIPIWGGMFWVTRLVIRFNRRYMARMLEEASKWDRD